MSGLDLRRNRYYREVRRNFIYVYLLPVCMWDICASSQRPLDMEHLLSQRETARRTSMYIYIYSFREGSRSEKINMCTVRDRNSWKKISIFSLKVQKSLEKINIFSVPDTASYIKG